MGEMPDGRPLMLGGRQGEGVSAGDEGRLLYTQHANRVERANGEEHKQVHSKTKQLTSQSNSAVRVVALMYHLIHISPTNVPLRPNAKDYFLLICRFHQRRLHLQSLFTPAFNLPETAGRLSLAQGDNSEITVRLTPPN